MKTPKKKTSKGLHAKRNKISPTEKVVATVSKKPISSSRVSIDPAIAIHNNDHGDYTEKAISKFGRVRKQLYINFENLAGGKADSGNSRSMPAGGPR